MPQQTLDERFLGGAPTRGPGELRRWMNAEEKRFVLWGLKEEWSSARIAEALRVNEATVRRFRARFAKAPNAVFDLNVSETVDSPNGQLFRCLVCADSVDKANEVDRHVLAHFLAGSDLESAVAVQSALQREPQVPMFQASDDIETSAKEPESFPEAAPLAYPSLAELPSDTNTVDIVPDDADRVDMVLALRRLAALPDTIQPENTLGSSKVDPIEKTDDDHPQESFSEPSEEGHSEVGTAEIHSAFERLAERRGLSDDFPTGEESQFKPPDQVGNLASKIPQAPTQLHEELAIRDDATGIGPEAVDDGRSSTRSGPRPAAASAADFATRWIHIARDSLRRQNLFTGIGGREATTVTIESGAMKLLSIRGLNVLDHRIVPLGPLLYSGGIVADPGTISRHLTAALGTMDGLHRRVYAAIPGYQSAMRRMDLPDVGELDPKVVVPREARRTLGVVAENSTLRWRRLPGRSRVARWLVAAASDASYSAISTVVKGAGHKLRALEIRPFSLARAVGHPNVLCVSTSPDGCDVVVVRDWVPRTYQSVYWEAGSVANTADLVQRLTEVLENTIDLHILHNPEISLPEDVPVVVTGGQVEHHLGLGALVAANVGRGTVEGVNPLNVLSDFPYGSMVVNVGLALWDA